MKIDVNEQYMVILREVYNPVIIRDESAGGVAVCERDGKIEVTWLKAGEDTKEQIANSPAPPVQHSQHEIPECNGGNCHVAYKCNNLRGSKGCAELRANG